MDMTWKIIDALGAAMLPQLPYALGLSIFFTVATCFKSQACNPGKVWWRNRELFTDVQYFFIGPIIMPYLRIIMMLLIACILRGALSERDIVDYIQNGRGPVSQLPFWGQVAFYVIVGDFLLYWSHRMFHNLVLWPFHAVHHSSIDLDWTSTFRTHPINQMLGSGLVSIFMLMIGVPPVIMLALVPFDIISAAFVHANLNWTLGPLKYVVATPVFHRWHHTGVDEGGDSNFSPTFSIWDYVFGTFYMPEGQLPKEYGVDDPLFPTTWAGQMIVPFKQFIDRLQQPPKVKTT
jgi:sterol desaturase/sphingolipid hydroxylase (fatty acid hydroxylase superfamily)